MVEARIARWGNSLAVRVPKHLASEAGLADGTVVELTADAGGLRLAVVKQGVPSLAELLALVTDDNRHGELLAGPPVGDETW